MADGSIEPSGGVTGARAVWEPRRTRSAIVAATVSAVVPGAGHWYMGRRRIGLLLFVPFAAVAVAGLVLARRGTSDVLGLLVQPRYLWIVVTVNAVLLLLRIFAVIDSHRTGGNPRPASRVRAAAALAVMTALLIFVTAPHVVVMAYGLDAIDTLNTVFVDDDPPPKTFEEIVLAAAPPPPVENPEETVPDPAWHTPNLSPDVARELIPEPDRNPFIPEITPRDPSIFDAPFPEMEQLEGLDRVTILLAGGDAGPGRGGLRTDTIIVASFDRATGRAALFGIPRNMGYVPLPSRFQRAFLDREKQVKEAERGYRAAQAAEAGLELPPDPGEFASCKCFPEMINALYTFTRNWTRSFPDTPDPGMEMLSLTLSRLLGIPIDYYVLVDMSGFVELIDALGGIDINVIEAVNTRVSPPVEGEEWIRVNLEPGAQHLTGNEALAYVRARYGTSDYARMERQRCLVKSVVAEADTFTLFRAFPAIADAVKTSTTTNIPLNFLPDLVDLALDLDLNDIATVAFLPGYYAPERDFRGIAIPSTRRIQSKVRRVLEEGITDSGASELTECG